MVTFEVIDKKTGDYADIETIASTEEWANGLIYCDMEGFAILQDGQLLLLDECGKYVYCPADRFEVMNLMRSEEKREEMSEKLKPIERCAADVIEVTPCKVGDAVYVLVKGRKVKKYIVSGIIIDQNNTWIDVKEIDNPYGGGLLNALQFGEDVFRTSDEAEAALLLQLRNGADMRGEE